MNASEVIILGNFRWRLWGNQRPRDQSKAKFQNLALIDPLPQLLGLQVPQSRHPKLPWILSSKANVLSVWFFSVSSVLLPTLPILYEIWKPHPIIPYSRGGCAGLCGLKDHPAFYPGKKVASHGLLSPCDVEKGSYSGLSPPIWRVVRNLNSFLHYSSQGNASIVGSDAENLDDARWCVWRKCSQGTCCEE